MSTNLHERQVDSNSEISQTWQHELAWAAALQAEMLIRGQIVSVPAPGTTNFKVPGPWKSGTVKPFKRGNTETVEALRKRIEDAIAEAEVGCLCACPCLCPIATLDSAHCRLQDADAAPDAQREALSAGLTPSSYTSPSASPASQRSVRQHGQSGKPSPESAAQMPPPPRPKRQQRAGGEGEDGGQEEEELDDAPAHLP